MENTSRGYLSRYAGPTQHSLWSNTRPRQQSRPQISSLGLREPPELPSQALRNPLHNPLWSSPCYIRAHGLSTTLKGRVSPITRKGLSLLPRRPETSASPTWVSAVVTGTFHTLITVYLGLRLTLPDSAELPPGLYSSTMYPSCKTHIRRTIQPLNTRLFYFKWLTYYVLLIINL